MFKATDWEPFEISPCTVPADFNTCFLSAQPTGEVTIFGTPDSGVIDALRAISPQKEKPAMRTTTTQETGADARTVNEQALAAAREEAVQAERERVSEIQALGATAIKYGIDETVISEFIAKGVSVDQARKELFAHLATKGQQGVPPRAGADGPAFPIRGEGGTSVTRDGMEQRLACMQMALLLRADGRFFLARRRDHNGNDTRRISRWLRSRAAAARRRDGPRVPQFQAHRHGEGSPGTARHQPARDGRDADCGAGAPGILARTWSSSRAAPNRPRTSRRSWPTSPTRLCARATKPIRAPSSRSAGR